MICKVRLLSPNTSATSPENFTLLPTNVENVSNYVTGSIVMYNNKVYISNTYNNNFHPNQKQWVDISTISKFDSSITYSKSDIVISTDSYYISLVDKNKGNNIENSLVWERTVNKPTADLFYWKLIEIWNPTKRYEQQAYVVHNNVLYRNGKRRVNQIEQQLHRPQNPYLEMLPGFEPGVDVDWARQYSLVPDTDYTYSIYSNPIILLNDRYYMATNKTEDSTLDNGIVIYINKKWENILVNINISDNTYTNVSSTAVFTDTRANAGAYSAGGITETQDQPSTITNYYLHRSTGSETDYSANPCYINGDNNIREYTEAEFDAIMKEMIRYVAVNLNSHKIRYYIGGSGTNMGSGMADTKLNGSTYAQREVGGDDYRTQEFPSGSATTINTYYLKARKE